jgi:hypothetical protein
MPAIISIPSKAREQSPHKVAQALTLVSETKTDQDQDSIKARYTDNYSAQVPD